MIGSSQTLVIGSLSLTLGEDAFDADFAGGLGYRRSIVETHQVGVGRSFFGATIIDGPRFVSKYNFEWQLNLKQADLLMLLAICHTQQTAAKAQQPPAVRLRDQRFALLEPTPRTRAKVGNTGITPPAGFVVIWPQFDLLLTMPTDFSEWLLWSSPTEDLYKVKLLGVELDRVGTGADL